MDNYHAGVPAVAMNLLKQWRSILNINKISNVK
jgi:hypothetical protein